MLSVGLSASAHSKGYRMTTESEVILARYQAVEKEADDLGRLIGVRRLKPSEQAKISGMTTDLNGYEEIDERDEAGAPTGKKAHMPTRLPLQIAASVCEIDGVRIPFAKSRGELDAIYDRLDAEGLAAAGRAFLRLTEKAGSLDAKADAKN
jgi:hypothetical protein